MIEIIPMTLDHLDQVLEIEQSSFSVPWTRESIIQELTDNKVAIYIVAVEDGDIFGYAGMWHVVTEGHITNVAVNPDSRGRGVGDMLVRRLVDIGREKEMIGLTLEVRVGNAAAMKLYTKHGFKVEGYRKNYYSDTKEDAVIMWKYL